MTIEQYARAIAEATRDEYVRKVSRGKEDYAYFRAKDVDLDAIIASVPKPDVLGTLVKEREVLAAEVDHLNCPSPRRVSFGFATTRQKLKAAIDRAKEKS